MRGRSRTPAQAASQLRVVVYTDYVYRRSGDGVYTERAFALFLARLAAELNRVVVLGRLDPVPGEWHYRLPPSMRFVGLPFYARLTDPAVAVPAILRSLRRAWRALDDVDAAWLLGPHPLAFVLAAMAALRGRRVVLGARQDLRRYVAGRHPGRRGHLLLAVLLERGFRLLARTCAIVVVGPELARQYSHARRQLEIGVSLVRERDIGSPEVAAKRSYDGQLQVLSVGRLDAEKNPLLLADVLRALRAGDPRWRLVVCGDGPLREPLARRLEALGLADHAELRGYVPLDGGLVDLYRSSHAFLHVSLTEGLPQVLFEAFAQRLAVVATAVGGVPGAAADAALLVPPREPRAAADALARLARDESLRRRLTEAGVARVRARTVEAESRRVAAFLAGA